MGPKNLISFCLVLMWAGCAAIGQQTAPNSPVNKAPLDRDQLAIYRVVMAATLDERMTHVNLADLTVLLDTEAPSGNAECGKRLQLETAPTEVHKLKTADFATLTKIRVIDPSRGRRETRDDDPGRAILASASAEDAVANSYARGMITLSEIWFDKTHEHAIVSYSYVCGELCGHGETIMLTKTKSGWKPSGGCATWMS